MTLQEGDGSGRVVAGVGGEIEVELVTRDYDDKNEEIDKIGLKNSRIHVFQDLEIVNDNVLGTIGEARVSTNALLFIKKKWKRIWNWRWKRKFKRKTWIQI